MDSQHTSSTKLDVYEMVTNRIIELLEKGVIPWQKPWAEVGVPMNLISKRAYRGINLWLLLSLNYERNLFLTWDQLKKLGGSVNQGEHGHIVVFWKNVKKQPEELDSNKNPKQIPMLRYYKVFNVEQCRDIPKEIMPELFKNEKDPIVECESIFNNMPDSPLLIFKGKQAYYDVAADHIILPHLKYFKTSESYYTTLFHELVHCTGSEKRLGRKSLIDMVPFGSESYAMEELIAEMGAAYLAQHSGILPVEINNTVAYIDNWLGVFKKDTRFLISASGQAQKAVDCIMNVQIAKDERQEVFEEVVG